ncbi:ELM1/GtrOC1 family putative glycosyltransferase [Maioricimonas sp. JC845]|uniref:mitochondrial fission ELM1 family protein n=1 Tax=Maioricimonas sp. JC845 TaxID=3232138 RepID=UPI0034592998
MNSDRRLRIFGTESPPSGSRDVRNGSENVPPDTTAVWYLTDGRPGHRTQIDGLLQALDRLTPLRSREIPITDRWGWLPEALRGQFPEVPAPERPDLILACGHKTHLPGLWLRRRVGGRLIVLMRPTLPPQLFDLCILPDFHRIPLSPRVVATRGVINPMCPVAGGQIRPRSGLILLGGPSRHHRWSGPDILHQIRRLIRRDPTRHWTLSTSRRTPEDLVAALSGPDIGNLTVHPVAETPPGWLREELPRHETVFVTEDSISMLYEALTAGARVGLIHVPSRRRGRHSRCIESLIRDGWISPLETWERAGRLPAPPGRLAEAQRCAEIICDRFLRAA